MTNPHYISESKSDMRGIKCGWYAIDNEGNIVTGPFSTREECMEKNLESINGLPPSALL